MDTKFINESNFYDTQSVNNIKQPNINNINTSHYLSIRDQDKSIECINNNCRIIDNKRVRFNINDKQESNDDVKINKRNNFGYITDMIIDYLFIFTVILLSLGGILNKDSKNLVILLIVTLLYIFYKKWIEKML